MLLPTLANVSLPSARFVGCVGERISFGEKPTMTCFAAMSALNVVAKVFRKTVWLSQVENSIGQLTEYLDECVDSQLVPGRFVYILVFSFRLFVRLFCCRMFGFC